MDEPHDEEDRHQRQHQPGRGGNRQGHVHDELDEDAGQHGGGEGGGQPRHEVAERPDETGREDQDGGEDESADRLGKGHSRRGADQRRAGRRPGQHDGDAIAPGQRHAAEGLGQGDGGEPGDGLPRRRPHGLRRRDHQRHGAGRADQRRDDACGEGGERQGHGRLGGNDEGTSLLSPAGPLRQPAGEWHRCGGARQAAGAAIACAAAACLRSLRAPSGQPSRRSGRPRPKAIVPRSAHSASAPARFLTAVS